MLYVHMCIMHVHVYYVHVHVHVHVHVGSIITPYIVQYTCTCTLQRFPELKKKILYIAILENVAVTEAH